MSHEQAIAKTAEITVATVQHMADRAGITFGETLAAILAGGAAKTRFEQCIATATEYIRGGGR